MIVLLTLAAIVLGVPLISYGLYLRENARAGLLPRVRELCGGQLLLPVLLAAWNSMWSIGLVVLAYPLGWFPKRKAQRSGSCGLPPVILVHGLYHNSSAWLSFRYRLRKTGFCDVRTYSYASFFCSFEPIVEGLVREALQAAQDAPEGRVLLVGHSLGGLVIRAACVEETLRAKVSGILTLGTPHRGSDLAGLLALGCLGRGLRPEGEVLAFVHSQPASVETALSLYSPTDSMVLPLDGSLLEERELRAGWTEKCLPPVSHVGMLYDQRVFEVGVEFLLRAASRPASP